MYKKRSFVREVFISRDRTLSKIIYAPKIFSRLWLEKKEIQYNQNNKLITFQKSVKMAKEDENVIFRKKNALNLLLHLFFVIYDQIMSSLVTVEALRKRLSVKKTSRIDRLCMWPFANSELWIWPI